MYHLYNQNRYIVHEYIQCKTMPMFTFNYIITIVSFNIYFHRFFYHLLSWFLLTFTFVHSLTSEFVVLIIIYIYRTFTFVVFLTFTFMVLLHLLSWFLLTFTFMVFFNIYFHGFFFQHLLSWFLLTFTFLVSFNIYFHGFF